MNRSLIAIAALVLAAGAARAGTQGRTGTVVVTH